MCHWDAKSSLAIGIEQSIDLHDKTLKTLNEGVKTLFSIQRLKVSVIYAIAFSFTVAEGKE